MAPPAAITSVSMASVKKITAVHDIKMERFVEKRNAAIHACKDYLLNNLRPDNLVQVLILGYLCKDDALKDAAISMMCKNVGPLGKLKD